MLAERLVPGQADLLPHRRRQRLGGDDEAVDGDDRAVRARAATTTTPRWPGRPGRRGRCPRVVWTQPGSTDVARVLSWTRTPRRRTASASPRTSAAGCTRAHHGVHVPPRTRVAASRDGGAGGVEQLDPVDAAVGLVDLVLGAGPAQLRLAAGQHHRAAPGPAAVDALGRDDPADLVDRAVHRVAHGQGLLAAVAVLQRAHRGGEQRRAPAAVAPARPVAGDVRLDDGDPQVRPGPGQVVRGPQPRVAGADDADVDVGVALEHVGRHQRVAGVGDLLVPQRQRPVPAHARPSGHAPT